MRPAAMSASYFSTRARAWARARRWRARSPVAATEPRSDEATEGLTSAWLLTVAAAFVGAEFRETAGGAVRRPPGSGAGSEAMLSGVFGAAGRPGVRGAASR